VDGAISLARYHAEVWFRVEVVSVLPTVMPGALSKRLPHFVKPVQVIEMVNLLRVTVNHALFSTLSPNLASA
jgi:poly-beta-hydroxyalkanoate depolymerase